MGKRRPVWQPQRILRHVRSFPSGAGTILVATDAGNGFLKAMGNSGGEHCLACEYVGTQLARWFELATFDFALLDVTEVDELPFSKSGKARPGPAFITRQERGGPWGGSERELRRLVNPDDLTRLVIFDTWTLNWDRHSVGDKGDTRINRDNVFLSEEAPRRHLRLMAMDHTHCFMKGRDLTVRLARLEKVRDTRVYGLFPQFRAFLSREAAERAVERLRQFTRADAEQLAQSIPKEWDVTEGARKALADYLHSRAGYLVASIMTMLWPQEHLDFGKEGEAQP